MKTKKIFSYFLLFIILLSAELALLAGAMSFPKDAIREHVRISAEYLCEKPPFFSLTEGDISSRIDRHADAILLNLAFACDSDAPLRSALSSAYYYDEYANENDNLLYAVTHDAAPTYEYMRYWHGSLVVIRPLLAVFTLPQIYMLGGIVLATLFLFAAFYIYRAFGKAPLLGFLFAACACSVWYVPFSLEYMPAFVIGFASVPLTISMQRKHPELIGFLFFALGSVTAFTDFLTTETLTCLLPLILVLLSEHGQNNKPVFTCVKSGLLWLIGYGATWVSKWLLYSVVFEKNAFSDALTQSAYRAGGEVASGGIVSQMFLAFVRNLRCLFPFSLIKDPAGMVTGIAFVALTGMVFWVIRKQKHLPSVVTAFWLIGLLPYIRYAVLSNHAYIHYFFTYRAQFASVFCLCLIFWLGTDVDFLKREWKKMRRKR